MKNILIILLSISMLSTMAQGFKPTKEQIANVEKIKQLQKTNKNGKNSKAIIELLNMNIEISKKAKTDNLKNKK